MEVCDWMGWSFNSPVARRYIHFFPKAKIKMAQKLDNPRDELKVVSVGNLVKTMHMQCICCIELV